MQNSTPANVHNRIFCPVAVPAGAARPAFKICILTFVSVDKSEDDVERESQLLECRLTLTEERNAVLVPSAGSGIPGAPVERCVFLFFT